MKEDNNAMNIHHTQPPVKLSLSSPTNATTILNKIQMQVNGASNPLTAAINGNGAQTNKSGYKIVVNNYHAHSILSSQDNNNVTTCLINTPPLDASAKLYQQIGDAPTLISKHKNVDNFFSINLEKPKSKTSKDNELETIKDVPSNENTASGEEFSTPNETTPPPKSVIVLQSKPPKCEVTGEDDIGSNLDDDDDEDLGGELFIIF